MLFFNIRSVAIIYALSLFTVPAVAEERWFYLSTNLLVDKNVENAVKLVDRAAVAAGYNGVVLTDSKFMRWDDLPARYLVNAKRLRAECREKKVACIVAVCPIGYSNDLLGHDPNLAEGLPVVDAVFVARDGKLVPQLDTPALINGSFEQSKNNVPRGWSFVDAPGQITFIDNVEHTDGQASLRMQNIVKHDPQNGHGRACQTLKVKPFHYYHVSTMVKTRDFESAKDVHVAVLAEDGTALNYFDPKIEKTQDWKQIDITFNSLEFSKANLYLGIWGGKGGTIWWDDVHLEPGGLVNTVRRAGAPLTITSEDHKTTYREGIDFADARDPKLGTDPWPGAFTAWHEQPTIKLPARSRIHDGDKVLLNYYHTSLIYGEQVMCCMAEPKVRELLAWQIAAVHRNLQPDGYFLSHDEIRVQGYDASCRKTGQTPGQELAANVEHCIATIRKEDPGKTVYVWSDMFDPYHNAARKGRYYLVRGDGPWCDSWKGFDKDVVVVNWNSDPSKRVDSLKHFAALGNRQILAGYYDGPVEKIRPWIHDAMKVPGYDGVMYTTWQNNYGELERFATAIKVN